MQVKDKNFFLIRFDADEVVGMGHFSRCYALGRQLLDIGEDVFFVSKHINSNIERILLEANQQYLKVPDNVRWNEEADFIKKRFDRGFAGFVLDVATSYAFEDVIGVASYLNALRKHAKTILLDGMGDNALSPRVQSPIDIIVMPYFGASQLMPEIKKETVYLMGPEYYVFPPEYRRNGRPKREIRRIADRVLVTLGGADPLSVTVRVIEALLSVQDFKLDVRLVIGANFSAELRERIQKMAVSLPHHCAILDCPKSLFEHMLWCDVAITSSGLTKYELAVTGTPSLQISFNEDHARVNEFFVRNGSVKHLGTHPNVGIDFIFRELQGLLGDYDGRKRMSLLGQDLLDAHGVNRIIEAMRS